MITVKGSYLGNCLDTQKAVDFFVRSLIRAPFKVAKLFELIQVFQLLKEDRIGRHYVLDASGSSINHILGLFSDPISLCT